MTKPSGTNSTKQLESLTFFTDQDASCGDIIRVLESAGASVVQLRNAYVDTNTADEVWLEACSVKNWIVISRNKRIRYVPSQLEKIMRHKGRVFFIASPKPMTGVQMGERVENAIPAILKAVSSYSGPFIIKLLAGGVVSGWHGTCKGIHF